MKNKNTEIQVVCVDVDETLLLHQSQKQFLKYLFQENIISLSYYLQILTWFILYKLGLAHDPNKVMQYAYRIVRGKTIAEVDELVSDFFEKRLRSTFNLRIHEKVIDYRESGAHVLLVSNSTDIVVEKIAHHLGLDTYFATKLSRNNGVFDGKIIPPIMYGAQKVHALKQYLSEKNMQHAHIIAYSDHISDLPLLEWADEAHVVNPQGKLKQIAEEKGWDIIHTE